MGQFIAVFLGVAIIVKIAMMFKEFSGRYPCQLYRQGSYWSVDCEVEEHTKVELRGGDAVV